MTALITIDVVDFSGQRSHHPLQNMRLTLPTSQTYTLDVQRVAVLVDGAPHRHGEPTTSPSRSLTLSSRHLLSPQLAASWCPAWPRALRQRGPLPRLRLSVQSGPRPRPADLGATPPAAWRGVARARLPSWAIFHSAPQAGGRFGPAPPGRRRDRKAQSARRRSRRPRLSAGCVLSSCLNKWDCGGNLGPKHLVTA